MGGVILRLTGIPDFGIVPDAALAALEDDW